MSRSSTSLNRHLHTEHGSELVIKVVAGCCCCCCRCTVLRLLLLLAVVIQFQFVILLLIIVVAAARPPSSPSFVPQIVCCFLPWRFPFLSFQNICTMLMAGFQRVVCHRHLADSVSVSVQSVFTGSAVTLPASVSLTMNWATLRWNCAKCGAGMQKTLRRPNSLLRAIQFVCGSVSYRHYLKFLCPVVRGILLLCTYFIFLSIVVCRALSFV